MRNGPLGSTVSDVQFITVGENKIMNEQQFSVKKNVSVLALKTSHCVTDIGR